MRDALIVSVLSVLPRNLFARWMGATARTGISRALTRVFVQAYGVDMSEAEHGIEHYDSLDSLFTRRLAEGARPVDPAPDAIVSPVDGTVAWVGTTEGGQFEVAPGRSLSVPDLLGEAAPGEHDVAVLYLSPKDYHRVHVAREGTAVRWRYVPGTLWPVFPAAVRTVDGLFARNERVAVHTTTTAGPLVSVLVGAFGVGRIELAFADMLTNTNGSACEQRTDVPLTRGGDLGVFHLGSTVVLVAPAGTWRWTSSVGDSVRMGQRLGTTSMEQASA